MSAFAMRKVAYGRVFVTASADNASANASNAYRRSLRRLALCILSFPSPKIVVRSDASSGWQARPDWKIASFIAPYTLIPCPSIAS